MKKQAKEKDILPKIIFKTRDQEGKQPPYCVEKPDLTVKGVHLRLWYEKIGLAAYLSQLELQALFERAFRLSFSAGFHPMPKLSFGKALPVGVASTAEWINAFFREDFEPTEVIKRLIPLMPEGLRPLKAERLSMGKKQPQSVEEVFALTFATKPDKWLQHWRDFMAAKEFIVEKRSKKGMKNVDIRPVVKEIEESKDGLTIVFDWRTSYMSPLALAKFVMDGISPLNFTLTKTAQRFD